MIIENQNTPGPDDLSDDTDIATTQGNGATDPLGQVSESGEDAEVNTADANDEINDMSDES